MAFSVVPLSTRSHPPTSSVLLVCNMLLLVSKTLSAYQFTVLIGAHLCCVSVHTLVPGGGNNILVFPKFLVSSSLFSCSTDVSAAVLRSSNRSSVPVLDLPILCPENPPKLCFPIVKQSEVTVGCPSRLEIILYYSLTLRHDHRI